MPSFIHKMILEVVRHSNAMETVEKAVVEGYVPREKPGPRLRLRFTIAETIFQDFPVYQYGRAENGKPLCYFIHGGGFIMGLTKVHFEPLGALHSRLGAPVIAPDFPLPPETDAAGVVDYVAAHLQEVMAQYPDSPIILCGDSAGAHLSLNVAQRLNKTQTERIKGLFLLFGVYDMRQPGSELVFHRDEVILNPKMADASPTHWAGDLGVDHPLVSPILGRLTDLPCLYIYCADRDPLYPGGQRFMQALEDAGTPYQYYLFSGYGHDFVLFPSPDGKRGLSKIAADMKACLL